MKLVYEENEKQKLRLAHEQVKKYTKSCLFCEDEPDRVYSIDFTVKDPAIAEHILVGLLRNKLEDFDMGIEVRAICINKSQNIEETKRKLHEAIENFVV